MFYDKLLTSVPGLGWPAAPAAPAAMRMAMLQQLDETQWWTAEMLQRHQMFQLQELLKHAVQHVPFYRERLTQAGWRPGEMLTPESFQTIPVLTRDEVNRAGEGMNAASVPKEHGRLIKVSTSGSTGNPVTVYKTYWCQLLWEVITLRDHFWQNRDFSGSLAVIRHMPVGDAVPPLGAHMKNWGPPVSSLFATGTGHALNIRSKTSEQLDWLLKADPDYLLTFPSAVEAMVRLSIQRGQLPQRLREVRTLGETLSAETRGIIQESWNITVTDAYSAQEIGYIALQAPGVEHYLVQAETVYVELLDEDNQPCAPGKPGRVVITPLHNFATPLIRYSIGDYAEAGVASPCGRGLPVLNRVLGRSRNMLVLPNGERRFAAFGIKRYNRENGEKLRKYQVIQKTPEMLIVKLAMYERYAAAEEEALRKHIQTSVDCPFNIVLDYVDDIPPSPTGKYEDFRSEVFL